MNYKIILFILTFFILAGCNQDIQNKNSIKFSPEQKYKNTGFTLVYNNKLRKEKKISKRIDNRSLSIFHKSLKKNSFVKITNPINQKTIIAEVISNNVIFSDFYNSVITKRIAEELLLDENEPHVDLVLISSNSTFIAKKAKTFDEEKNVSEKAPVDGITIDNLGVSKMKKKQKKKPNSKYIIKIADFYYQDSAINMINKIKKETSLQRYDLKKLSNTKYRVLIGPFSDIKKLEEAFNEIKLLKFENLEILKNV